MLRTPSNLCLSSASFVNTFVRAASFQAQLAELNFVNGRRSKPNDAGNCEVIDSIEPRSGKTLGQFYLSGREEVSRAIDSAKIGLDIWRKISDFDKSRIMQNAAGILRERKADIVYLDAIDTGRVISECEMDVDAAIESLEFYSSLLHVPFGQHIPFQDGSFAYTRREPLGICVGIGAWNFPFLNIAWKVAPAISCGNAVVYKPSPFTPVSSVIFAEVLHEAGLPPGVLNVIQGGAETGSLLCRHEHVAKVSFTGSGTTGTKIMQACAEGIKRVTLELGGKSPLVIFADAELENALNGALLANYLTQGQVCSNAARVYVQRPIFDEFLEKIVKKVNNITVGDPLKPSSQMGALISEEHLQKVLGYVDVAKKEGARILCGGERMRLDDPELQNGFYMSPCVMDNCNDQMTIVKEEHFGPVMSVLAFDTEEEAIARSNDTKYGLAGGVFTKDLPRAHRFISNLQAGSCYINTYNMYPVQIPFGGYKQSGFGRENGLAVLDGYSQVKSVYVENNDVSPPF
eukprot:gene10578-19313_t